MLKNIVAIVSTAITLMLSGCGSEPVDKPMDIDSNEQIESSMQESEKNTELSSEELTNATEIATVITTEAITVATTELITKEPVVVNTSALSNEKNGWYFNPNDEHKKPTASDKIDLNKYDAYYVGTTDEKVIYLTFDEGYENGYSSKILDVLKEKNVTACFFVTKSYIERNQDLIKRMVAEGHVVGNHSVRHLSSPDLSDEEFKKELTDTADYFKEVTGQEMPKVFRPPMGEYSERTLALAQSLGYKTVFWSFAYRDWLTDDQPGKDVAYNTVMKRYHNGCVTLLHAVSQSNTEALPDIIDSLRANGYEFRSLEEIK